MYKTLATTLFLLLAGCAEQRACMHMSSLCGKDFDSGKCTSSLKSLAAHSDRTTTCVAEATSCTEAHACMAGGALREGAEAVGDAIKGLGKALGGDDKK